MKVLVFFSFCTALLTGLFSCSRSVPADSVSDGTDSLSSSRAMMNTASGVVTDETTLNIISIATPQGDTMRIHKGNAVIEGSGIIVGDSAVVYYMFEVVADSAENKPVASRIVTKPAPAMKKK